MSSSQAELSSSATTAIDSTLSVNNSTIQTVSPPTQSHTHSRSNSNPKPQESSKGKDIANDTHLDPTNAHAEPSSSSNPDAQSSTMDAATTEAARNAIMAHLSNVGSASLAPMSQRAADIGAAHASIAKQRDAVDVGAVKLSKESAKLDKEIEKADGVLKDIGNVDNWAQLLERDIEVLEETLRIVDEEEGIEGEEAAEEDGEILGEDGLPIDRKKKGKAKEGWLWGLLGGGKAGES